jgi:hypothetical protein
MTTAAKSHQQSSPTSETGAARSGHENGVSASHRASRRSFGDALRIAREMPAVARRELKARPMATLVAVGGISFLLGAVCGSRLARAALYAAIPYVITRLIEGEFGERLRQTGQELLGHPGDGTARAGD